MDLGEYTDKMKLLGHLKIKLLAHFKLMISLFSNSSVY